MFTWAPNWARLAPNGINLKLFKTSFSTFWLTEPQICPIWFKSDPICGNPDTPVSHQVSYIGDMDARFDQQSENVLADQLILRFTLSDPNYPYDPFHGHSDIPMTLSMATLTSL